MHLEQHDVPRAVHGPLHRPDGGHQLGGVDVRVLERRAPPGGRVEHDPAVPDGDPGVLEPPAHGARIGQRLGLTVGAGMALLDHGPREDALHAVGAAVHRVGHVGVGREQVVGVEEVAGDVAGEHPALGHVEAHVLERDPVPGVDVHLPGPLGQLLGERRVVDQVLGGGERPEVVRGQDLDEPHPRVVGELGGDLGVAGQVVEHPDVLEVRHVRLVEQVPEDGLGVVEHPVAGERLVEHHVVQDRQGAPVRVAPLEHRLLHGPVAGAERQPAAGIAHQCATVHAHLARTARTRRTMRRGREAAGEWVVCSTAG